MAIFATFKYSGKKIKQQLCCMDHSPHVCERIDDGKVNLVKCKSHDFNHGLKKVGFHGQLKQTLSSIQIPTWKNGRNNRIYYSVRIFFWPKLDF
jgi:hypothetical protein